MAHIRQSWPWLELFSGKFLEHLLGESFGDLGKDVSTESHSSRLPPWPCRCPDRIESRRVFIMNTIRPQGIGAINLISEKGMLRFPMGTRVRDGDLSG